ncbi:hypothetical protein [Limnoglobus roseus]|uniref:Uncharacterized protein n=1 Tax=Limnoglobus roseus TaxID=2598579 RepID=A0A5C1AIV2_9BACT|nr:hypothetical protein [Limnoglobus roseus]QEL19091.1 hypothetical protein PX52LOC_06148 [Limnoglobus roseus]
MPCPPTLSPHLALRLRGVAPAGSWTLSVSADCLRDGERLQYNHARWSFRLRDAARGEVARGDEVLAARGMARLRAGWQGLRYGLAALAFGLDRTGASPPGLIVRGPDRVLLGLDGGACGPGTAPDRDGCWGLLARLGLTWQTISA